MNSKITSLERSTLLNFLKTGLSTRQLDSQIGENPQKSKGWKSWSLKQPRQKLCQHAQELQQ